MKNAGIRFRGWNPAKPSARASACRATGSGWGRRTCREFGREFGSLPSGRAQFLFGRPAANDQPEQKYKWQKKIMQASCIKYTRASWDALHKKSHFATGNSLKSLRGCAGCSVRSRKAMKSSANSSGIDSHASLYSICNPIENSPIRPRSYVVRVSIVLNHPASMSLLMDKAKHLPRPKSHTILQSASLRQEQSPRCHFQAASRVFEQTAEPITT